MSVCGVFDGAAAPTTQTSLAETAAIPRNWSRYCPVVSGWDASANDVVHPGVGVGVGGVVGVAVGVGVGRFAARASAFGVAAAEFASAAANSATSSATAIALKRAGHELKRGSVLPLIQPPPRISRHP